MSLIYKFININNAAQHMARGIRDSQINRCSILELILNFVTFL